MSGVGYAREGEMSGDGFVRRRCPVMVMQGRTMIL